MSRHHHEEPSQRQLRVGEELRHTLASILERGEVRDPDLRGVSVTVSEVRVSPDLRRATAFVTPLGGGDSQAMLAALGRAGPFLRRRIASAVRLRHAPALSFEADRSFDQAARIDTLLREADGDRPEDDTGDRDHGS